VQIDVDSVDLMAMNGLAMLDLFLRLATATFLGALVGLERERLERAAGFRTHALVCVASALIMVVSIYGFSGAGQGLDPSRIAAQVVSGIGFLGAGVIIFRRNTVRGLTTAASLWSVAGVGLASGSGLYIPAAAGTFFMLLIQAGMRPLEAHFFPHQDTLHRIMVEIVDSSVLLSRMSTIAGRLGVRIQTIQLEHNDDSGLDTVEITIRVLKPDDRFELLDALQQIPGVQRVTHGRGVASLRRTGRTGVLFDDHNGDDDEEDEDE